MSQLPEAIVNPVVQDSGFTLVEEDDVAFTLALCREIHRLYGSYQDGDLPGDEQVWAGLDLTRRMVLTLQAAVTAGMPAMRLQVAASQTREMMAVLFGDQVGAKRPKLRSSAKDLPCESAASVPAELQLPPTSSQASPPAAAAVATAATAAAAVATAATPATAVATAASEATPAAAARGARLSDRWDRQRTLVRLGVGLLFCVLLAVLINLPIVVMALYPNHLTQIAAAYAVIGLAAWRWQRKRTAHAARPARLSRATRSAHATRSTHVTRRAQDHSFDRVGSAPAPVSPA